MLFWVLLYEVSVFRFAIVIKLNLLYAFPNTGVAGGAASGKTAVCDMIIQQLHDQRVVLVNQVDIILTGFLPTLLIALCLSHFGYLINNHVFIIWFHIYGCSYLLKQMQLFLPATWHERRFFLSSNSIIILQILLEERQCV